MNCETYRLKIHEKLRGALDDDTRAQLADHVGSCPECTRFTDACQELTCKQFVDFLHAYLDGEFSGERLATVERHLSVCPDCTTYLESYRRTISLSVSAMTELSEKLPEEIPEGLLRAILDDRKREE
jgi:anti-sigma factor RsiW